MTMDPTATVAWYPDATDESLPPMMLETDLRLSCEHLDDKSLSILANGTQCPVYKYSNTLAYKPVCRKRETKLMVIASELTLRVVSKVGVVDDMSAQWYQKGAVMELGYPLDVTKILPAERVSIAKQMMILVTSLHRKGILHGDIKPERFVKQPGSDSLKIAGFSSARMIDDSDLNTWPGEAPAVEYTSPNRSGAASEEEASTPFDDYYALAVSIWSVFSGERPMVGLFNSNQGHVPDISKITDDELFCSVVDVLEEGGLQLDTPVTLARRNSMSIDPSNRSVSFPLSLFGADPDDLDDHNGVKSKPTFCPHCFEIAMSNADKIAAKTPKAAPVYPEFSHLRNSRHDVAAASDYALQWLEGQEIGDGADNPPYLEDMPRPDSAEGHPRTRSPPRNTNLRVDTSTDQEVEKPPWSAVSGATITATNQASRRERSDTVRGAPSASDEGYESLGWASGGANELQHPKQQQRSRGLSFQRTMSAWSESSVGSTADDGSESRGNGWTEDTQSNCSSPPRTPMPLNLKRLQVTSSFESVDLAEAQGGRNTGGQ
jgi:serine/threonine protein kinase